MIDCFLSLVFLLKKSDKLPGFPLQINHEQKNPSKDRTHINSFKWVCLNRHPNSIGLIASLSLGVSLIFGQTYIHSSLVDSQCFDVFVHNQVPNEDMSRDVKRQEHHPCIYIYTYIYIHIYIYICIYIYINRQAYEQLSTLWLLNVVMENHPCQDISSISS